MNEQHRAKVAAGEGFFAALDQSGGSTPGALAEYGVPEGAYSTDDEMFDLMHQMRARVVKSPAFGGDRVLGAILFVQTMDRKVDGVLTGDFLWEQKQVVPFVKVDKGLQDEVDHAQLMKPIPDLEEVCSRAYDLGLFGTKMRSLVKQADPAGVEAIVDQQFAVAARIAATGLVPILEPEVSIHADDKDGAERLLADACLERMASVSGDVPYLFKVSIPEDPTRYDDLIAHPGVLRVVCLSGGWSRDEACARLAAAPNLIASFSRALLEGLTAQQSAEEFDATLEHSIAEIYAASTH